MDFKRLLVVIDPEHEQQPALLRAIWLARQSGAHLHLLQLDYHPSLDGGLLDNHMLARAREALLANRTQALEEQVAPWREEGLNITLDVCWSKRRHAEILAHAQTLQPDLLLHCAPSHGTLQRLLLGDSCWQLIRHCPVPLWLVGEQHWRGEHLCAALDPVHSGDKPAALDHQLIQLSLQMQQHLGLQAHCIHALAPLPQSLLFDAEVVQAYDDYVKQCTQEHRQAFTQLLAPYPVEQARVHLLDGFAEEVIPRFVHTHKIDLLVMGAVARGHLDNLIIGHTAERVLQRVGCDLLLLNSQRKG